MIESNGQLQDIKLTNDDVFPLIGKLVVENEYLKRQINLLQAELRRCVEASIKTKPSIISDGQ